VHEPTARDYAPTDDGSARTRRFCRCAHKGKPSFFIHKDDPKRWATVPMHRGDLRNDTVRDILKQTKISREQFLKLL
jgi:predicted RNA binding protein YcfA (HicA-like mRNA interferase family)